MFLKRTVKHPKAATQKKTKIGLKDRLSLNAGRKYCRMLQWALSTCIKQQSVFKTLV